MIKQTRKQFIVKSNLRNGSPTNEQMKKKMSRPFETTQKDL